MTKSRTIPASALAALFSTTAMGISVANAGEVRLLVAAAAALGAVAALAAVALAIADRKSAERAVAQAEQESSRKLAERDATWERNVEGLEQQIVRLEDEAASQEHTRATLAQAISLIRETAPIITGLANKAIEKSEHGSTSLTEDVYELGKQSTSLGESITGFLTEMSYGDESLQHHIEELNMDARRLSDIADLYDEANTSIDRSINRVSESVGHTSELIEQVSDIAEQTSILAINAAIYAAKAGEYGQGFSVIASEIQKLARTAKEVAETIGTNTTTIERQVSEFSNTHKALMHESQASLSETIGSIENTIEILKPKAERISGSIQNAAEVSSRVTRQLNEINMAMQEQDAIQQIVAHIADILQEAIDRAPSLKAEATLEDQKDIRELARTLAVRHFTMKDEFVAVGDDGYAVSTQASATLDDGSELAGDVTLF